MPMYDFLCSSCFNHEERFFKMSEVPASVSCSLCSLPSPRTYDPSLTLARPRAALTFDPIVVHRRRLENGDFQYSYPGTSSDPIPEGYEKVELTTLSQADRFVNDRNREEQELRTMQLKGERQYWEERTKERRAAVQVELEKRLGKSHSRIGELVQRAVDARREKRYKELESRNINFHIQALSYDAKNRPDYRAEGEKKISVVVNGLRR